MADSVHPGAAAASPHASSVAVAAGTPVGSVFIKIAGDARAHFAPVDIFASDAVCHLAKRASRELAWGTSAAYVELFLVPAESEDALAAGKVGPEALILATRLLSSIKALSAVGIFDRSCLLARLTDSPAAVPGECAHEPVSLLSCSRSWRPEGLTGCAWAPSHAPIMPPPVPCRCARCCCCCCWRWRGPSGVALTG